MKCERCGGYMVDDVFYGPEGSFSGMKCMGCGEVIDPVIMENRQLMREGRLLLPPNANHIKANSSRYYKPTTVP